VLRSLTSDVSWPEEGFVSKKLLLIIVELMTTTSLDLNISKSQNVFGLNLNQMHLDFCLYLSPEGVFYNHL
jgi:hypothetical protein